jgi:deoxyribodipyrimidine photo-lyase
VNDIRLTDDVYREGDVYKVFTPFLREARKRLIEKPIKTDVKNVSNNSIVNKWCIELGDIKHVFNEKVIVRGGRKKGLERLKLIANGFFKDYEVNRDYPALKQTTLMSEYNKFGCISIREFYHVLVETYGKEHGLVVQLYWRDFYYYVLERYPRNLGHAMREKYDDIEWSGKKEWLDAWKEGKTGCPIVDAGMRQMNETGFMHNRVRMIVSNYLIKDLHIDWREGEIYFAQMLVDYDPAQNNGGWQWSAGTGTDSQPYFRIFNPYSQSKKFDKDCEYIKEWVPELSGVKNKDIHEWETAWEKNKGVYMEPLVKHSEERLKTLEAYKIATQK